MIEIPSHRSLGRLTPARVRARETLVRTLWNAQGERRLPADRALWRALAACDPRDVWWVCEMNSYGPLYFLPTREWVLALARLLDRLGVRRVLEAGAGDGFLARALALARPDLVVRACDSHAWGKAKARMSPRDAREFSGVRVQGIPIGAEVERLAIEAAVVKHRPELVLVAWAPPGTLVERAIRSPVRYVLDVSVDGDVCGNGSKTWRFEKEFLAGAIEARGVCRLDDGRSERKTRATLYEGAKTRRRAAAGGRRADRRR